jgi:hypothetical protein
MTVEEKCRAKLKEVQEEVDELYGLEDMYKDKSEFHRFMYRLKIKQYLLEEILEINE